MSWSAHAIATIDPIYQKIMMHPFVQALADGSLDPTKFRYYMEQDALYLAQYRKIMAAIAAKCDDSHHQLQFLHSASATIATELMVHQHFLADIDISACVACQNNLLYTGHLYQQLSTQPLAVIVASILPCFYLYQQVGSTLNSSSNTPDHPYHIWLSTYASESFEHDVLAVTAIANELAQKTIEPIRKAMTEAFITSAKMEWLFWDAAWQKQSWPI